MKKKHESECRARERVVVTWVPTVMVSIDGRQHAHATGLKAVHRECDAGHEWVELEDTGPCIDCTGSLKDRKPDGQTVE